MNYDPDTDTFAVAFPVTCCGPLTIVNATDARVKSQSTIMLECAGCGEEMYVTALLRRAKHREINAAAAWETVVDDDRANGLKYMPEAATA